MKTIKKWINDNDIEEVEALIPDISGIAKGKFIPAERYLKDNGFRIAEAIFTQTITGNYTDYIDSINPTDVDMEARPVKDSIRLVPWASPPTAQIIHDCYQLDGNPVEGAPRHVLKRILDLYEKKGWNPIIAPEIEFYLVKNNSNPASPLEPPVGRSGRQENSKQAFSVDALIEFDSLIRDIYDYSKIQNLEVETLTHEDGMVQLEVNFMHGEPMSLADQVFLFKRTVRQAAHKHNIYATFMAKPYMDQPGSSMHIHQSIINNKTGNNIFVSKNDKHNTLFKNYIAGLQKYTPATMLLYAPNVNSYRRISPNNSAPINTHWGIDNRTVGLRVPISSPEATRVENRMPGSDTNPYLSIAATLAAGYLGIQEKLQPTKPLENSAYDLDITLPRDLHTSLRLMDKSKPVRNILGDEFVKLYLAVKELEHKTFSQVITPWEREHLLLNV